MAQTMLDRPGADTPLGKILTLGREIPEDRLGLALALAGQMYGRKIPRTDVAKFLRGEPTHGSRSWNVRWDETIEDKDDLGMVLDLITKMHNGTLPKDEVEKYLRGEAADGSKYWLVGKPNRTIKTLGYENFDVMSRFSRGEHGAYLRVANVDNGFKTRMPKTIKSTKEGSVALRPIRSETTAEKVFASVGRDAGVVSLPAFYDVLAHKQRNWWNYSPILAFVASNKGEVAMLYGSWQIMFGFGEGPDLVEAFRLSDRKQRELNFMVGIEVVVRGD